MAETVNLPKLGFDMREGMILNWVKQVGDAVNKGEVLAEIESDKATIEVESPASGVLLQTLVRVGDTVPVGDPIAVIGAAGEAPATAKANGNGKTAQVAAPATAVATTPAETPAPTSEPADDDLPGGLRATPVARKMAEERGLDLHLVTGTGPNGRISKSDVENYKVPASTPPSPAPAQQAIPPRPAAPAPTGPGIEEIPLTRLRQRIGTRMVESKQAIPHFYVTSEIEMDAALALRKQINEPLDDEHKVSVNDLVVKATALALREFPNLNTHFYGDKLIRYSNINIGIAVALDAGGLMNVVAKDADITSISKLAARNKEMIAGARAGKVRPEDVEGGTFTVSNLGPFEVDQFVAIINPPEAGIIAVGSAKQVPVIINGEFKVATRMKATLSADHRVTDGAEAAQFMQAFKRLLENPMRLLV